MGYDGPGPGGILDLECMYHSNVSANLNKGLILRNLTVGTGNGGRGTKASENNHHFSMIFLASSHLIFLPFSADPIGRYPRYQ